MDKVLKDTWIHAVQVRPENTYKIEGANMAQMSRCRYCHVICPGEFCSVPCYNDHAESSMHIAIQDAIDSATMDISDGPSYQSWLDGQNNMTQNEHNDPEWAAGQVVFGEDDIPW